MEWADTFSHLRAVLRPGVLTSNTMGPLLAVLLEHPWHRICVLTLDHKPWAAGRVYTKLLKVLLCWPPTPERSHYRWLATADRGCPAVPRLRAVRGLNHTLERRAAPRGTSRRWQHALPRSSAAPG
eukprot:scaffold21791_cov55-Phaeocystis_antarctica.AAC.3